VLSLKDNLVAKFFRPLQWLSALMSRMLNNKRNYLTANMTGLKYRSELFKLFSGLDKA